MKPEHVSERGLESAELVIEMLSPHDEARAKFAFYAHASVREIWLIHPLTRIHEIHFGWFRTRSTRVRRPPSPTSFADACLAGLQNTDLRLLLLCKVRGAIRFLTGLDVKLDRRL